MLPSKRLCFLVFALGLLSICVHGGAAQAAEFHVSPGGDDNNSGSEEKPFATAHRAQQAARKQAGAEMVTVWFHRGIHYLAAPLQFTDKDSGTQRFPVTYRAADDEVVISGGQMLAFRWTPYKDGIYQATTPDGVEIDQLFVNEQRQPMARYPNFDPNVRHFHGYAADAFSKQRAAHWKNPVGGFIHAMHRAHWGGYHYRITGKNDAGEVTYEGGWQNNRQMGMHGEHRFVENVFEELDAAGEWYHDAGKNRLFYKPQPTIDLSSARVEVVRLRHLIEFVGSEQKPVRHISLQGLTFRHAARTFMDNREPLLRSDWTIYRGGAVLFHGAEHCQVARCTFDQLGGNAIFVNNYNRQLEILGCHIHDAGGNGVCFVGNPQAVRNPLFHYDQRQSFDDIDKAPGPKSNDYPSECLVENCLIVRTGRVEKQTAGVQISMSSKITVRHCSIYEVPRAGINISEGTFGGHLIEFCDVFDTVLETGDHGSFNSWGRDRFWGLKDAPDQQLPELAKLDMVAQNVIRNSRWRCDHGWDIDLDDGSSNYLVYNNLLLKGGLKFREGFNRVAENNVMVGNSFHPHVWYKNSHDIFRHNIVFTDYRPIRVPTPWGDYVDQNLLHRAGVLEPTPAASLQKQSGRDEKSLIADACFVDTEAGDYRVKENSPAIALGFKNFPMDRFGVQLAELKKLARTPELHATSSKPVLPAAAPISVDHYWAGARIRDLAGDDFSSFGVSKEAGGIHLAEIPQNSDAAEFRFQQNDLIQKVNGESVKSIADLFHAQSELAGKPMQIGIVRDQKELQLDVPRYSYFIQTVSDEGGFAALKTSGETAISIASISARPATANQPVSILTDGKLTDDYGPVFGNGIAGGMYRIDLGESKKVTSITTVSFNQNQKRGAQRYLVFGSNAAHDPPWRPNDRSVYEPIGEVDTVDKPTSRFQATRIQSNEGALGTYRWLLWVVYPVTNLAENTAFQELIVE